MRRSATSPIYLATLLSVVALFPWEPLLAEETQIERAAAKLLQSTVTIRITSPAKPAAKQEGSPGNTKGTKLSAASQGVTVCSGTSLGQGLILTFGRLTGNRLSDASKLNYRVTLPDGAQSTAQVQVVDHYSGLVLLQIDDQKLTGQKLTGLPLADKLPKIGGTVLTAAAAGIDQPLVSSGVLSGVDRTVPGLELPPLALCDISTTAASSGAALINPQAELLGIIVATGTHGEQFGWSYSVPFRYIRRVLDARLKDRLVVLVRRRPTVGFQLGPGPEEGSVLVERVVKGGPADRAGIKKGDYVWEAEGRKMRSAYQVVAQILKRQPGQQMALVVGSADARKSVRVTLGGSATVVSNPRPTATQQVQVGPQLNLRVASGNRIEVRNRNNVAELSVKGKPAASQRSPGNEVELLRAQLEAYKNVIEAMQKERLQRDSQQHKTDQVLESLRAEVEKLKKQIK